MTTVITHIFMDLLHRLNSEQVEVQSVKILLSSSTRLNHHMNLLEANIIQRQLLVNAKRKSAGKDAGNL